MVRTEKGGRRPFFNTRSTPCYTALAMIPILALLTPYPLLLSCNDQHKDLDITISVDTTYVPGTTSSPSRSKQLQLVSPSHECALLTVSPPATVVCSNHHNGLHCSPPPPPHDLYHSPPPPPVPLLIGFRGSQAP